MLCPTQNCTNGDEMPVILILGNKTDLESERKIQTDMARRAAEEFDTLFAEVSAKTGKGIEAVRN